MFTAKIFDVTDGKEEMLGYVTIDEETPEVVNVASDSSYASEIETAVAQNLDEIVDLHTVMLADPNADDSLGIEMDTPEMDMLSILITNEED